MQTWLQNSPRARLACACRHESRARHGHTVHLLPLLRETAPPRARRAGATQLSVAAPPQLTRHQSQDRGESIRRRLLSCDAPCLALGRFEVDWSNKSRSEPQSAAARAQLHRSAPAATARACCASSRRFHAISDLTICGERGGDAHTAAVSRGVDAPPPEKLPVRSARRAASPRAARGQSCASGGARGGRGRRARARVANGAARRRLRCRRLRRGGGTDVGGRSRHFVASAPEAEFLRQTTV